jgi:hypothetical protein
VFDTGQESRQLPECILRGVQWTILDEVVCIEFVEVAKIHAANYKAEQVRIADEKKVAFAADVEAMRTNPEYAHLRQMDGDNPYDKINHGLAAKNIRLDLKKYYPTVKFSVRSDHNSVAVRYPEGAVNQHEVYEMLCKFKCGSFDGMTDSYNYRRSPFNTVYGEIEYISVQQAY